MQFYHTHITHCYSGAGRSGGSGKSRASQACEEAQYLNHCSHLLATQVLADLEAQKKAAEQARRVKEAQRAQKKPTKYKGGLTIEEHSDEEDSGEFHARNTVRMMW